MELDPQIVNLTKAIRSAESNDNFTARSKDGSFGAYQFIKPTWDSTSKKYGVNAEWEKATPQQQNEVAYKQVSDWKKQGYNVGQIASMWNAGAGRPNAYLEGLKGVNSAGVAYDTSAYAKKVAEKYQELKRGKIYEPTPLPVAEEKEPRDGFLKALVRPVATMAARPIQLGYELFKKGDNTAELDKFSKEKLGGFVAPVPQGFDDLKKDIGRGIQTVAMGMPGLASGGAAFGLGTSLEQGNDLLSLETAFQTTLGAAGAKVIGLVGQPLLDAGGRVIGKITPQILKDIALGGSKAIVEFAARHKILPTAASKAITRGANKAEDIIAKPFDVTGQAIKKTFTKTPESIIRAREAELAAIDSNYVNMRKASGFSKDAGAASRRRIASTDVLVDAVDENGLIRTANAVKLYKAQTIDGAENVVKNNLIRLGETVPVKTVERELLGAVKQSSLEGADLVTALNGIKREIAGIKLKADAKGKIPLVLAHDAKINTTNGINYLTPPEVKTYRKAIASGYKKTVEKNSKFNTEEVNKEISKYLEDIAFLKRLDGKRVKGGKLGKYFAQISGNIVGGAAGAAIGGIPGSAVGTVIGGELGGRIRGSMLKRALGGRAGITAPRNKVIDTATALSKTPYSNKSGNLKAIYKKTSKPTKAPIKKIIPPKSKGVDSEVGITSFRGKAVKTVKEVAPYYETTRAKGFENNINKTANDFNIKVNDIRKVAGSWEGNIEPSYSVIVKGTAKDKIAYAAANAKRANQDAVILFTKGKGDGIKYSFENVKNPDKALKVLHSNGVSGATLYKNHIVVYDMDNSLAKKLKTFTSLTGNKPTKTYGKIQLIEKKDYDKFIYRGGRRGDGNSVRPEKTAKIVRPPKLGSKTENKNPFTKFLGTAKGKIQDFIDAPNLGLAMENVTSGSSQLGKKIVTEGTQKPTIKLKRDVTVTTLSGNKAIIDEGEVLKAYESGGKALLKDGREYIVSKSQYENIKNNSIKAEAKEFAPELKRTEETVKGIEKMAIRDKAYADFDAGKITREQRNAIIDKLGVPNETKYSQYQLPEGKNYKEILIKASMDSTYDGTRQSLFKSSHWDEPNVISHLRLNERTYKGKKVTFMEELQSDWARNVRGKEQIAKNTGIPYKDGELLTHPSLKNWQEMTVKRALKDAVDNNSDYFAWINGEQTSARYNLATHVDNVEWKTTKNAIVPKGSKYIKIKAKGSNSVDVEVDHNGVITMSSRIGQTGDWAGKKLDEVLGKGLADKIMEKETGTLSGEGLKFGGEWANTLYDKQVGNIVKDLTGAPVIKIDMGLPVDKVKNIIYASTDTGAMGKLLKYDDLKIGKNVSMSKTPGGTMNQYIITDILGDGKFKAVPKSQLYLGDSVGTALIKDGTYKPITIGDKKYYVSRNELETFDISQKTTTQQAIRLTPEIKAMVKGEAPKLKLPTKPPKL